MNGYELKALRKFKEHFQEKYGQGFSILSECGDAEDFDETYTEAAEKAIEELDGCDFEFELYFGIVEIIENGEMGK